jgi:hypothetical protein
MTKPTTRIFATLALFAALAFGCSTAEPPRLFGAIELVITVDADHELPEEMLTIEAVRWVGAQPRDWSTRRLVTHLLDLGREWVG